MSTSDAEKDITYENLIAIYGKQSVSYANLQLIFFALWIIISILAAVNWQYGEDKKC